MSAEVAPFQLIELHPIPRQWERRSAGYRIGGDQSAGMPDIPQPISGWPAGPEVRSGSQGQGLLSRPAPAPSVVHSIAEGMPRRSELSQGARALNRLRDSGECRLVLSILPEEEIVGSERGALS